MLEEILASNKGIYTVEGFCEIAFTFIGDMFTRNFTTWSISYKLCMAIVVGAAWPIYVALRQKSQKVKTPLGQNSHYRNLIDKTAKGE